MERITSSGRTTWTEDGIISLLPLSQATQQNANKHPHSERDSNPEPIKR
jgi:hypothetical protein